ncbi:phage terminase large subunit, partial [Pseudomonas aeruginosa]|nr:phage terminase large subunit [Pseudomonas aeruginosa]MDI4087613.1 phage terminase large subunit [Pseudomonas aeruginosa]
MTTFVAAPLNLNITLPFKLAPLYEARRYKVMRGGRGGGKSHGVAQVLLDMGARNPLRILCAREIQKSMRDSVHRLLRDYIVKLGLTEFYEVLDTEIRG